MKVTSKVACIANKKDWSTGKNIIKYIDLIIDSDNEHLLKHITIKDMKQIERNSHKHASKSSYVIVVMHGKNVLPGEKESSLVQYLLELPVRTRRKKNYPCNEYTRESYGL